MSKFWVRNAHACAMYMQAQTCKKNMACIYKYIYIQWKKLKFAPYNFILFKNNLFIDLIEINMIKTLSDLSMNTGSFPRPLMNTINSLKWHSNICNMALG